MKQTKHLFATSMMAVAMALGSATTAMADGNPYLPLWEHLPDGEPRVFEDPDQPGKYRIYIIGSHDLAVTQYCGADIHMWSAPTEDLTNWRDEGSIFTYQQRDGKWDIMFAPDLVEIKRPDGTKEYYLYPHSRGWRREAMVCKGSRPDGPFTPVNLNREGATTEGSVLGFDPSIFVENITDPADPDFDKGFRAYGFWGFQRSSAAQLDQNTMYSVRPGTEIIPYFIPACFPNGQVKDPAGTTYPALHKDQVPNEFGFFEASSIRKVGNKYVMIFSGYSGKEYGLGNTNSTLRYAFGDSPMGPWRSGGVLVDSRGVVLNQDGSALMTTNAAHNTHGSIEQINGKWYVFYHRPPRGFGYARQAVVAPISIKCDEKSVADGGRVVISAYDPYAKDGKWEAKASNGNTYTGAEVTSEGFQIYGLDPYKYYSAGYACFLTNGQAMQDTWDIWDNNMPVLFKGKDIVGFKYFGFGGLKKAKDGLRPFEGTKAGNKTQLNVFVKKSTDKAFKMSVWVDGPWANKTWNGKKLGEIEVPAGIGDEVVRLTLDVPAVDKMDKKHAIYLVSEGDNADGCTLMGLGFSKKGQTLDFPAAPVLSIQIDGKDIEMPQTPVRFTADNGMTGYDQYEVNYTVPAGQKTIPVVTAKASSADVKISIEQTYRQAVLKCDYNGMVKTYTVNLK